MKFIILLILYLSVPLLSLSQQIDLPSSKDKNINKPSMFINLQDTSEVHSSLFKTVFNFKLDQRVNLPLMKNMDIKGKVNILLITPEYHSVSIESEEKLGLRLIISKNIEGKYFGVIGCINHKDVLILSQKEDNQYYWIKKEYADILPD